MRVDVGNVDGASFDSGGDEPPKPASGKSGAVGVAVVLALLAVAAVVFLLRPDDGVAADGSQRQATTTTTTTPDETAEPESEEGAGDDDLDATTPEGLTVVEVEGLETAAGSFAIFVEPGTEETGGYFASTFFGGNRAVPQVFRSLNGQNWIRVETTVLDDADTPGGFEFGNFHRRDDGFGIFRVRSSPTAGISNSNTIDLFTSENGAEWELETNLRVAEDESDNLAFPTVIGSEPALVGINDGIAAAIIERSGQQSAVSPVCFVGAFDQSIVIGDCFGDEDEIFAPEGGDSASFDALFACLTELDNGGFESNFEFRFPLSDEPGSFSAIRQISGLTTRLDDGRIVSFVEPASAVPLECADFGDLLPEEAPRGIAIWDGPGSAEIIDLNVDVGFLFSNRFGAQPVAGGDRLWAIAEAGLFMIGLDGSAELVVPIDGVGEFTGLNAYLATTEEGAVLTRIVGGVLTQHFIDGQGSVETIENQLAVDRPSFRADEFIFVDDQVALFLDERGVPQSVQLS